MSYCDKPFENSKESRHLISGIARAIPGGMGLRSHIGIFGYTNEPEGTFLFSVFFVFVISEVKI